MASRSVIVIAAASGVRLKPHDFVLEGGLNVDTGGSGQGGQLFGRQAFGALRTPFGTASAGRQYSSIYTQTGEFSEFSNVSVGATTVGASMCASITGT